MKEQERKVEKRRSVHSTLDVIFFISLSPSLSCFMKESGEVVRITVLGVSLLLLFPFPFELYFFRGVFLTFEIRVDSFALRRSDETGSPTAVFLSSFFVLFFFILLLILAFVFRRGCIIGEPCRVSSISRYVARRVS